MKRTIDQDVAVPAGAGGAAAGVVPEAARRPLRELMDDRLLERVGAENLCHLAGCSADHWLLGPRRLPGRGTIFGLWG